MELHQLQGLFYSRYYYQREQLEVIFQKMFTFIKKQSKHTQWSEKNNYWIIKRGNSDNSLLWLVYSIKHYLLFSYVLAQVDTPEPTKKNHKQL